MSFQCYFSLTNAIELFQMILILLLVGLLTLLYYYAIKPFNYWANKNVPTGKVIPIFGDNLNMILGKENLGQLVESMYNKLPNARYIGCYQFQLPVLVLRSPELIKQICVKDFDHFLNHRNIFSGNNDELWSKNLVALKGQTWKNMRSTLSPSFTSSKMRLMFNLISQNAELFMKYFLNKNEEIVEVEFKDAYTRYTNDVIASVGFGVQVDSLENRNNEFYEMGRNAMNFNTPIMKFKFLIFQLAPKLAEFLRITLFGGKITNFFMNLVKDTIKIRKDNNINRPDVLGLLMEARDGIQRENTANEAKDTSFAAVEEHLEMKEVKPDLTDSDIAAQVFVFFLAGFETVSTAMCFMAQELVENPDVQKRLIEEIDENKPKKGAPSYDTIMKMTYLDMVTSETLRKWPISVMTDRVVTKPYTIQPELPEEKPVHLDINDNIIIPMYGIHRDPQYYENPEKFDPERFSPENKRTIDPYTYLPFGIGPRNCIGSRFALLEIKALFFYILSHFEIVPIEKTNIPLKLSKTVLTLTSINGFHLGLKRR